MIMAYHLTVGAELMTPEYGPGTDAMAQDGLQLEQSLAITKAIIELTDQLGSSNLVERSPRR